VLKYLINLYKYGRGWRQDAHMDEYISNKLCKFFYESFHEAVSVSGFNYNFIVLIRYLSNTAENNQWKLKT